MEQSLESILVLFKIFCLGTLRGESIVVGNGVCLEMNTPGNFPGGTKRSNVKIKSAAEEWGSVAVNSTVGTELCQLEACRGENPRQSRGVTSSRPHRPGDSSQHPERSVSAAGREAEVCWCTELMQKTAPGLTGTVNVSCGSFPMT